MAKEGKQRPAAVRVVRQLTVRYFQDTVSRSAAELAYYLEVTNRVSRKLLSVAG